MKPKYVEVVEFERHPKDQLELTAQVAVLTGKRGVLVRLSARAYRMTDRAAPRADR
jgi:hypothetical protein